MPSIRSASCAVALVLCSAAAHAQFAAGYTLTPIGQGHAPTETGGTPSINNAGQVVMSFYSEPARIWQNGVFTTLESGAGATAAFINNSGQVVGANRSSFVPYGWFGPNGTGPRTQWAVSSTTAFPVGINDAGDVAVSGPAFDPLGGRIYHSSSGTFSLTGLSSAHGIDNTGRVFGAIRTNGDVDAAVSLNGVATLLPVPGPYGTSIAYTGNTAGFIAGHHRVSGDAYPLLWSPVPVSPQNPTGFVMSSLPMPAGVTVTERVVPASMNEAGLIVGYMHGPAGRAFAWYQGAAIDLSTRLTAAPGLPIAGWQLISANDVNDLGQIVGVARFDGIEHVVLLNPVPAPGAAGVLMLCGGLAAAHRRRR